ncbi:HlyD family type I secretion periplasmic adaptor subunit [Ruegeria lacuscaerulensis]|uniref:HlyD family type I secretion periplasmic adaptor subunit n=1 Tax=Ruegeria lacuscaerulensis TaxID=55218 RepID=UPI00147BAD0E
MTRPVQQNNGQWSAKGPLILGVLTLFLLLGGFGAWAVLARISGAIIASGQIEVDQNRQVVQHPDGGVVAEILVDEGDVVRAGETLIRLDPSALESELAIAENQLYELMARRGRLEAERDGRESIRFDVILSEAAAKDSDAADLIAGQKRLFSARAASTRNEIAQLEKRANQIKNQIDGLAAQEAALSRQLELITQELAGQQRLLDRGLAQASRVLALQREDANLSGQMGDLKARKAEAEVRITEIGIEILKLATAQREDAISQLRDLTVRELGLREERRALLDRLARLNIKAPVAGVVYSLQVFALQSVVQQADPVLFIVPQDRPLVINTQVEAIHIDKLSIGQLVTLRFPALDQRKTPELSGRVVTISADAFEDNTSQLRYYRAEITLNEGETRRLPEGSILVPGMPVEAFIRTADRSPLGYLVKPMADYFAKAFRD